MQIVDYKLNGGLENELYQSELFAVVSETTHSTAFLSDYKKLGIYRRSKVYIFDFDETEQIKELIVKTVPKDKQEQFIEEFDGFIEIMQDLIRMEFVRYNPKIDVGLCESWRYRTKEERTKKQ